MCATQLTLSAAFEEQCNLVGGGEKGIKSCQTIQSVPGHSEPERHSSALPIVNHPSIQPAPFFLRFPHYPPTQHTPNDNSPSLLPYETEDLPNRALCPMPFMRPPMSKQPAHAIPFAKRRMGAVTSALCVSHVLSFSIGKSSPGRAVCVRDVRHERSFGSHQGSKYQINEVKPIHPAIPINSILGVRGPPPPPPTLSSPHPKDDVKPHSCAARPFQQHSICNYNSCRRGIVKDDKQVFRIWYDYQFLLFRP